MSTTPRTVQGVQIPYHADLSYAHTGAHKAATGLLIAMKKSASPHLSELYNQAIELIRSISRAEMTARVEIERIRDEDPEVWRQATEGDIPFPNERQDNFVPRCRCYDRCLWHDVLGHGPDEPLPPGSVCNCAVYCYRHKRIRGGDEL